jgi:hypothetical protein
MAWLDETVIEQAVAEVTREDSGWGTLRRRDPDAGTAPGADSGEGSAEDRAGQ